MLAMARGQARLSAEHASIEWHEGGADALPLAAASCDVAYCQLGLQYFPNRAGALAEMRRVLASGGRVALMVWRGIDHSPGFAALAEALDHHVSAAAGAVMRAPFVMEDVGEIEALLTSSGFRDIAISQEVGSVRFASIDRMVQCQVAGSPLAGHVAQAADANRVALLAEMNERLREFAGENGLAFPIAAHLVRAAV